MGNERYELDISGATTIFEFISEGPKGFIKKRIEYTPTQRKNIYNLGFGDIIEATNTLDDKVVSDNKDSKKVLATVASTIYTFASIYPKVAIYAEGSNSARTRLYRIGISNNLEELKETFNVYGFLENAGWELYQINKDYSAFLLKKKSIKNERNA